MDKIEEFKKEFSAFLEEHAESIEALKPTSKGQEDFNNLLTKYVRLGFTLERLEILVMDAVNARFPDLDHNISVE
jgi:hypothetical protein